MSHRVESGGGGIDDTIEHPEGAASWPICRWLRDQRGWDWGDEQANFFRRPRFASGPMPDEFAVTGDWAKAIRSMIGSPLRPAP